MKNKVGVFVVTFFVVFFVGFFRIYVEDKLANDTNIVALMFHSVDNDNENNRVVITPENLKSDLEYLIDRGYSFVDGEDTAEMLLDNLSNKGSKNIWITFDDGYRDNYYNLFPILKENNVKATINLIVKYVEEEDYIYHDRYLTWDMVDEMIQSDLVEFGCHTYDLHSMGANFLGKEVALLNGPCYVDNVLETDDEFFNKVLGDFSNAKALMQERTGKQVDIITYPYGVCSKVVKEIADLVGFKIEVGIKNGCNDDIADLVDVKRINVSNKYTPLELEKIINYYRGISIFSY